MFNMVAGRPAMLLSKGHRETSLTLQPQKVSTPLFFTLVILALGLKVLKSTLCHGLLLLEVPLTDLPSGKLLLFILLDPRRLFAKRPLVLGKGH